MKSIKETYNENIARINAILNKGGNPNHDKSGRFSTGSGGGKGDGELDSTYPGAGGFAAALDNVDKWLPDDSDLQDEYYQLIDSGDTAGMKEFLSLHASEDGLMSYGLSYGDIGTLAKAIVKPSKGGK